MRLPTPRPTRYDSGPNLTSLVDVVMVVLIFLMLAGSFSAARVLKGSSLPNARGSMSVANVLEIRVRNDGPTHSFVAAFGDERVVGDPDTLAGRLAARRRAYLAAGTDPAAIRVVVRPAGGVSYQHVLGVYESVRRAGFGHVAFARSN